MLAKGFSMIYVTLAFSSINLAAAARVFNNKLEQLAKSDAAREQEAFGGDYNVGKHDFFPVTPIAGFPRLRPTYPARHISPAIAIPPLRQSEEYGSNHIHDSGGHLDANGLHKGTEAYVLAGPAGDDATFSLDDSADASVESEDTLLFDAMEIDLGDIPILLGPQMNRLKKLPDKTFGQAQDQNVSIEKDRDKMMDQMAVAVSSPDVVEEASPLRLPCAWMIKTVASSKYILVVKAALATSALVACKVCLHNKGYGDIVTFTPILSSTTGASTFLNGFVLAALIADFKESEKLVSDVTGCLENVYQSAMLSNRKSRIDMDTVRMELGELADDIMYFLGKNNRSTDVFGDIFARIHSVQDIVGPANGARVIQEASVLNKILIRASHIKNVPFIPAAFAIAEVVTIMFAFGTIVLRFDPFYSSLAAYGLVLFVFIYLNLFYQELDEAFGPYPEKRGDCEVDLFVLKEFKERMNVREKMNPLNRS